MDAWLRSALALVGVTGVVLAGATSAGAAYAPSFTLKVDPPTANSASTITSTITQAVGETPSKTVTVALPPGFTPNPTNKLATCTADQEISLSCPPESRMGSATAAANAFGLTPTLTGPVFFGGSAGGTAFRLLVLLTDPVLGNQKLLGIAALQLDGTVTTVFDNLPPLLVTAFTLVLDGGEKALLRTPAKCGNYNASAAFVSQSGETASGSSPMPISGCSATATPTTPGSAGSTGTAPTTPVRVGLPKLTRAGVVTFALSAPARVVVTVTRAGKRVGRKSVSGKKGTNRVRLGRKVRKGSYRVSLSAVGPNGGKVTRARTVRLR